MSNIETIVDNFFEKVKSKDIEIYNEFSLQHELGIFLRAEFPKEKVQFEKNVVDFFGKKDGFTKKEIDISIFKDKLLSIVLELKFPRSGRVPESMFDICKDIKFLEELKASGFNKAYAIIVVDNHNFYSGKDSGIYGPFRNKDKTIEKPIEKPTGKVKQVLNIEGTYHIKWKHIGVTVEAIDKKKNKDIHYCLIEI